MDNKYKTDPAQARRQNGQNSNTSAASARFQNEFANETPANARVANAGNAGAARTSRAAEAARNAGAQYENEFGAETQAQNAREQANRNQNS